MKNSESSSEGQPVGLEKGSQWKRTSTWWDPGSHDQNLLSRQNRLKPKSHRTLRNVVWTDCCTPFPSAKTFNRMTSRYQFTLRPTDLLHPLINCTFCSPADRRDLSRPIKLTFVVALVMKTLMKTYLNYILKTKLIIYQLSASWNI